MPLLHLVKTIVITYCMAYLIKTSTAFREIPYDAAHIFKNILNFSKTTLATCPFQDFTNNL